MIDIKMLDSLCPVGTIQHFSPENNPNKYVGKWELIRERFIEISEKYGNDPIPYFYNDAHDKKVEVPICLWKRTA